MSLWSFQGAREPEAHPALERTTPAFKPAEPGLSKLNSVRKTDVEVDVLLGESDSPTAEAIKGSDAYRNEFPVFPRKEVIQPQLPLRLPCYDFTPIINPTFDGSLPCGLGHRLRVLPTFVV
jgi:hypothetical protein